MSSASGVLSTRMQLPGLFLGYALLCLWAFTPMLLALHDHWTTAHDLDAGYLLLVVTIYVLWQAAPSAPLAAPTNRKAHPQRVPERIVRGVALIGFVGGIAAASVAAITANKSVTLALLVLGFAPLCVWVTGARMMSSAVHACAILLMATPIWFVLVPQLQTLTATAVNWLLSRGSWPIYIEGNLIALPQGMLEIAAGCAGLKFLQTAIALTLIEGFVARRSWRAMAVIGVVAVLLAVFSNWLRVSVITLLALEFDPTHPWVADHNWVGWLLFGAIFGPLFFWLGGVELFTRRALSPAEAPVGIAHSGLRAAVALVIAFGVSMWLANAAEGQASQRIGAAQVAAVEEFCSNDLVATGADPATSGSDTAAVFPGATLLVDCVTAAGHHLALRGYVREQQEQEVINPVNQLVPGLGLLDYRVTSQTGAATATAPARVSGLLGSGVEVSIAYGFYATGNWAATPGEFKLRSLLRPFVPGPVYALIVVDDTGSTSTVSAGLDEEFIEIAEALRLARGR